MVARFASLFSRFPGKPLAVAVREWDCCVRLLQRMPWDPSHFEFASTVLEISRVEVFFPSMFASVCFSAVAGKPLISRENRISDFTGGTFVGERFV